MEDASGEDLDWFWRGWFFGTDACDISLDSVKSFKADPTIVASGVRDTVIKLKVAKPRLNSFDDISKVRNREDSTIQFNTDRDTTLRDFYWRYARGLENYDSSSYGLKTTVGSPPLDEETKQRIAGMNFYELKFSNKGGLVMPIILEWTFADGTKSIERIPAQIWRKNEKSITKVFMKDKEVVSVRLDPMRETADIDESNNKWPVVSTPSKFQVFKQNAADPRGGPAGVKNPMQNAKEKKGF
jgi:hypothetical protein